MFPRHSGCGIIVIIGMFGMWVGTILSNVKRFVPDSMRIYTSALYNMRQIAVSILHSFGGARPECGGNPQ